MTLIAPAATVVQTTYGPVRGTTDGPVDVWKGIRYAAAPTGRRRFAAPTAPVPWTEVFDADRFGAVGPQSATPGMSLGDDVRMDEDCLSLNVWSPGLTGERKPVLVWIHGGAYRSGSSSRPDCDGRALAAAGDVVVVTINYRLGVFGFVDFSSLNTDRHHFDTNVALQDMIAALRWVQMNIARFGGDPSRVTVFGESAGAGAVTTLMTMPSARCLFHRAIAESAPATSVHSQEWAAHVAREFLEILGGTDDPVERLLTADTAELLAASDALFARIPGDTPGTLAFAPVVDGDRLPDYPVNSYWNGTAARVPLLIGTKKDEVAPVEIASACAGSGAERGGTELPRDFGLRLPTLWIVEAHSRYAPTWLYRLDYATPLLQALGMGATRATELPYVFGDVAHGERDGNYLLGGLSTGRKISRRVQQRWLEFARCGIPDGLDGEPAWDPYDRFLRASLVIDKYDTVVPDLDGPLRTAWGEQVLAFT